MGFLGNQTCSCLFQITEHGNNLANTCQLQDVSHALGRIEYHKSAAISSDRLGRCHEQADPDGGNEHDFRKIQKHLSIFACTMLSKFPFHATHPFRVKYTCEFDQPDPMV